MWIMLDYTYIVNRKSIADGVGSTFCYLIAMVKQFIPVVLITRTVIRKNVLHRHASYSYKNVSKLT